METPFFVALSFNDLLFMLEGAGRTLALTFWSATFGTLLGAAVGWARASGPRPAAWLLGGYVDLVRSVPLIIQFILFNSFVAVIGHPMDPFLSGVIVLILYMGGLTSEVVRGGIDSVSGTTRRAARSLGLTYWQDLRYIVLPLGLRAVLPAWIGLVIGLVKDTSLVAVLGYIELLRAAQIVVTRTQEPMLILIGVGVAYFILCYPISRYSARLERKLVS